MCALLATCSQILVRIDKEMAYPIFYYRKGTLVISVTIAARDLKFWLQVALGPLIATRCAEIRVGSGKSGFFENPEFFFLLLQTSLDLGEVPPMYRNREIRTRIRKIRVFRKSGFFVFSTF